MDDASAKVIDLIFGRWRSQILYAGVKLGLFDALASGPRNTVSVAHELDVDAWPAALSAYASPGLPRAPARGPFQELRADPDGRAALPGSPC
jgi:hypothetical protein